MLTITTKNSVYEIRAGQMIESIACDDGSACTQRLGTGFLVVKKIAINPHSIHYEVGRSFIVRRFRIDAQGFAHFDFIKTSEVLKQEGILNVY